MLSEKEIKYYWRPIFICFSIYIKNLSTKYINIFKKYYLIEIKKNKNYHWKWHKWLTKIKLLIELWRRKKYEVGKGKGIRRGKSQQSKAPRSPTPFCRSVMLFLLVWQNTCRLIDVCVFLYFGLALQCTALDLLQEICFVQLNLETLRC